MSRGKHDSIICYNLWPGRITHYEHALNIIHELWPESYGHINMSRHKMVVVFPRGHRSAVKDILATAHCGAREAWWLDTLTVTEIMDIEPYPEEMRPE